MDTRDVDFHPPPGHPFIPSQIIAACSARMQGDSFSIGFAVEYAALLACAASEQTECGPSRSQAFVVRLVISPAVPCDSVTIISRGRDMLCFWRGCRRSLSQQMRCDATRQECDSCIWWLPCHAHSTTRCWQSRQCGSSNIGAKLMMRSTWAAFVVWLEHGAVTTWQAMRIDRFTNNA